jgi:hypothetical protein
LTPDAPDHLDERWDAVAGASVVALLAVGVLRQGGYPAAIHLPLALLGAAALLTAVAAAPLTADDLRWPPTLAGAALAGWALVDGVLHGEPTAGVRPALLVAGLVAMLLAGRRLGPAGRAVLVAGTLAVGAALAATGWIGVLRHRRPWGWPGQGLWRAAGTLTYPNAAAALLVMLALVAVGLLVERRRSALLGAAATALLVGAGATVSRAGALAAVLGAVALATLVGPGRLLRAAAAPVLGALVALAGLAPSLPESAPSRPVPAVLGLAAGLLIGTAVPMVRAPRRLGLVGAAAVLAVAAGLAAGSTALTAAAGALSDGRVSVSSADRFDGATAALRELRDHPVTGAGPGLDRLTWSDPAGGLHLLRYAHDEYLQVGAELGIVGLALLGGFLAAVGTLLRRPALDPPDGLRAGVVGGVVALAGHAAFDFVWHLPVIPLSAAALVGLASAAQPRHGSATGVEPVTGKGEA